jgi:hypothetical protein
MICLIPLLSLSQPPRTGAAGPPRMESVLVTVVTGTIRHLLGALDSFICLVDHALHGLLNLAGGLVQPPFVL